MRILFVMLLFVVTGAFRCEKDLGEDQYVTLFHKQTQCADPWGTSSNDSVTAANLSTYLNNQNVYVADITIKHDDVVEVCNACACKTGKTIYVSTFNNDSTIARYQRIGFKQ